MLYYDRTDFSDGLYVNKTKHIKSVMFIFIDIS